MDRLKTTRPLAAGLFLAFLASGSAHAADVYSPVVGFLKFDCPAASDTIVSVPFHPTPRWSGALSGAPTAQGPAMRLSLKNTPNFAGTELTDAPHFVYLRDDTSPASEGRHFLITAHAPDTVDIVAAAGDLTGLAVDSQISIIPGWTLATLFPPGTQTTFSASTGNLASTRGSELLMFDRDTAGTDLAPNRTFFVTASAWIEAGSFAEAGDEIIEPGQAFIVRNPAGVTTTFIPSQQVYGGAVALEIPVSSTSARDTALALPRPVPLTLAQLDLGTLFTESASTAENQRADELLVYDNADPERNKLPSAVYFRTGGQWVEDTTGFPASDSVTIEPSAGLVIRKAQAGSDDVLVWVNNPTYDVTAP